MKPLLLLLGTALALTSGWALAQNAPESLLPPGFDDPAPKAPAPRAEPAQTPVPRATSDAAPASVSRPVVQPIPGVPPPTESSVAGDATAIKLPPLEVLEKMSPEELEVALNLKPKFDIPPAARRSMQRTGLLDQSEGGLSPTSLAGQDASPWIATAGQTPVMSAVAT